MEFFNMACVVKNLWFTAEYGLSEHSPFVDSLTFTIFTTSTKSDTLPFSIQTQSLMPGLYMLELKNYERTNIRHLAILDLEGLLY